MKKVVINKIKKLKYKIILRNAMKEAEKISKHPERYKQYNNFEELMEDLNN